MWLAMDLVNDSGYNCFVGCWNVSMLLEFQASTTKDLAFHAIGTLSVCVTPAAHPPHVLYPYLFGEKCQNSACSLLNRQTHRSCMGGH